MSIWLDERDENEWYEKANKLITKYGYESEFDSDVWDATLIKIFCSFCDKACDEACEDDFISLLDDLDYDFLANADKSGVGLTYQEIEQFMHENELDELTIKDFMQMRGYYYEEIKDRMTGKLYDEYESCKDLFVNALKEEYGNSTIKKLFFFYVREGRYADAITLYDGSGDLWSLSENQEEYEDWGEDEPEEENNDWSEEGSDEDDKLKSGQMNGTQTAIPQKPILYSFIGGNALDYPNLNIVYEWIENDLN